MKQRFIQMPSFICLGCHKKNWEFLICAAQPTLLRPLPWAEFSISTPGPIEYGKCANMKGHASYMYAQAFPSPMVACVGFYEVLRFCVFSLSTAWAQPEHSLSNAWAQPEQCLSTAWAQPEHAWAQPEQSLRSQVWWKQHAIEWGLTSGNTSKSNFWHQQAANDASWHFFCLLCDHGPWSKAFFDG